MIGLHPADSLDLARQWWGETLAFFIRPLEIIRSYRPEYLRPDLMAALTMGVVTLPQAIAFALISDLPPQTGLYTAIVASIVGALWGSSIHLNTGPTNTTSLLVLSTLITVAHPGTPEYLAAAALMAVIVGVFRLVMGLARLGVLVNFVSNSVIIGLTAGAGFLIFVNQLKHLLRVDIPNSPYFFVTLLEIGQYLPQTHWLTLALGLATIGLIILTQRLRRSLPGPLIAIVMITALVGLLRLDEQGVSIMGELPHGFPPLASLPLTDFDLIQKLLVGSMAVAAIGLVEATSIARAIAVQSGQRLNSNQEFVGQGLANIAVGFFSGYTCAGSFSRSGVNYTAGARTPMSNVFTGLFVLIALLTVASYAAFIPRAALAGVLMVAAYGMVDRKAMKRIWYTSRGDSMIMVATLAATLILPLEYAVLSGIIVSIVRFLVKTSMPQVTSMVPDPNFRHFMPEEDHPVCPQVGIITIGGPLYFGATEHVERVVRANLARHPEQHFLLLRMHLVDHIDFSGIQALESITRLYRQRKGDVYFASVRRQVKHQMAASGFYKMLGYNHFLQRDEAVSYMFHKVLEPSICIYECPLRIFAECQALPKWDYGSKIPDDAVHPEHAIPSWLPSQLKERLSQNGTSIPPIVIDVREPAEYRKGHVPQARLVPMRLLPQEGHTLPTDRPIVLICRIGRRSRLAGGILKDMGYTDIYNLQGGILAWEAAGYPLAVE
ncbi:MAG: STAS domain-containing protein [Anaerolineales bacterium]|nr:STAS domain-containing protein [Anaerolineales bacterium]